MICYVIKASVAILRILEAMQRIILGPAHVPVCEVKSTIIAKLLHQRCSTRSHDNNMLHNNRLKFIITKMAKHANVPKSPKPTGAVEACLARNQRTSVSLLRQLHQCICIDLLRSVQRLPVATLNLRQEYLRQYPKSTLSCRNSRSHRDAVYSGKRLLRIQTL
jgi:hypothetical protein